MGTMSAEKNLNFDAHSPEEWVRAAQNGDALAVRAVILQYLPRAQSLAAGLCSNPCDREDLVQEGLIALYSAIRAFDFASSSFSTFASVCMKRGMLSALRRSAKKRSIPASLIDPLDGVHPAVGADPEAAVIDRESVESFGDAIRLTLSSFEYRVLSLYLRYGSVEQVCSCLGASSKKVSNALLRARKKIKKIGR